MGGSSLKQGQRFLLLRADGCYLPAFKYCEGGSRLGEEWVVPGGGVGYSEMWGRRASPARLPETPGVCSSSPMKDRGAQLEGGCGTLQLFL